MMQTRRTRIKTTFAAFLFESKQCYFLQVGGWRSVRELVASATTSMNVVFSDLLHLCCGGHKVQVSCSPTTQPVG